MKRLISMAILVAIILLPNVSLFARSAGHGAYGHGAYRHDRGAWEDAYGVYGEGYGGYVNPDPQSQPGMGDDSNALYQSYLKTHHQGGY